MTNLEVIEEKLFKYLKHTKMSPEDQKKFKNLIFNQKPFNIKYLTSR